MTPALDHPIWTYGGGSVSYPNEIPTWAREVTRFMPSRWVLTEADVDPLDGHVKPEFQFPSPTDFNPLAWDSDLARPFLPWGATVVLAASSGWTEPYAYRVDDNGLFQATSRMSIRCDMQGARRQALEQCFIGKWGWALAHPREVRSRLGLSVQQGDTARSYPSFPSMHATCLGATAFIAASNADGEEEGRRITARASDIAFAEILQQTSWSAAVSSGLVGGWRIAAMTYGFSEFHPSPWDHTMKGTV